MVALPFQIVTQETPGWHGLGLQGSNGDSAINQFLDLTKVLTPIGNWSGLKLERVGVFVLTCLVLSPSTIIEN